MIIARIMVASVVLAWAASAQVAELTVTTEELPAAVRGTPYSAQLRASGGVSPYVWTLAQGSLPQGLSLSLTGTISGTPTQTGNSNFRVRVTDLRLQSAEQRLNIRVEAPNPPRITTTSLPAATTGVAYSQTLTASGGSTPYTWRVSTGALPAGLSLSSGGQLTGTPTAAGDFTFTVAVSDAASQSGSAPLTLRVNAPPPTITTPNLPAARIGEPYSQALSGTGGTPPYSWSVTVGALPAGLTLSSGGQIAGTPTTVGDFSFTVRLADSANQSATRALNISVAGAPITISTTDLPGGRVGDGYSQTLAASGGAPPYNWAVTAGTLPPGLNLNPAGQIAGTPTTSGDFTFTVRASDSGGQSATRVLRITISAAQLLITTTSLPGGRVGDAYSQSVGASGGTPPYNWTVTAGALPPGVNLAPSGQLNGTPTAAGNYTFTLGVSEASNQTATRELSISISASPVVISTGSLPPTRVSDAYAFSLSASGGTPPYTWAVVNGTLPPGLDLNQAGQISGTSTTAGEYSFTAGVTDSAGQNTSRPLTLTVSPASVSVSTSSLPNGRVGEPYTQGLSATGGVSPYTWNLIGGSLPPGLSLNSAGQISGTPTTAGGFNFTVRAADASGGEGARQLGITIGASALSLSTPALAPAVVGAAYSQALSATGGTPPYAWSLVGGSLPAGLSLNATTGEISGTPTAPGQHNPLIRVRDAAGATVERSFPLPSTQGLAIAGCPAQTGRIGQPYSSTLAATGGSTPYVWSVTNGQLPPGVALDASTGALSGTPTASGTFPITFRVSDAAGQSETRSCPITVGSPLVILTRALPQGTTSALYSHTLAGTGGAPPYTWTTTAGSLPTGVTLGASTGVLSGIPGETGTFSFTLRFADATGAAVDAPLSLTVTSGITISSCPTAPAMAGRAYATSVTALGGRPPYTWSLTTGAFPSGVVLDGSTGALSGTPAQAGPAGFTLQVTDAGGATATRACTIDVATPLSIITETLPGAALGQPYSELLRATGGTPPYSWSTSAGALPPGLSLNSTEGRVSGSATQTGSFSSTIRVTDATGMFAERPITLTVSAGLTITSCPTPAAVAGEPYTSSISLAGSQGMVTWSIATGSLPEGLTLSGAEGVVSGTPSQLGAANFTLRAADAGSATASRACTITVGNAQLTIATPEALPDAVRASEYSYRLSGTGGTEPYAWTVTSGALPAGMQLAQDGTLSGTPELAGSFSFTVRLEDASRASTSRAFRLRVLAARAPTVTFSALPDIIGAAQQPRIDFSLASAYPVELRGRIILTFEPDPGLRDDPAIQFVSGGRTAEFTIPASATTPVFPVPQMLVQTGTVAGLIRLRIALEAEGVDVTPSPGPERTMRIDRVAPVITGTRIVQRAGGFDLWVTGYSTTLDVSSGAFRFSPAAGGAVQTPEATVQMRDASRAWFEDQNSVAHGGMFNLVQPFNVQGVTLRAVSVTLTNAQGTSQAADANF